MITAKSCYNMLHYDLMTLVVIKLGEEVYNGDQEDEGYDLLRFLSAVLYQHERGSRETLSEYIDFSKNRELWEEAEHVSGLGETIFKQGVKEGREEGIKALILDNLEEGIPQERILLKLQKRFGLDEERAKAYFEEFVLN